MITRKLLLASTALASAFSLGTAVNVRAADLYEPDAPKAYALDENLPAVSGLNGKIAVYGGYQEDEIDDGGIFGAVGSISVPLGHRFGAQVDAQVAAVEDDVFGRLGGHLFWRDPSKGLVGVYGAVEGYDDTDMDAWRIALEAEGYIDRVTIRGMAGYESVNLPFPANDEDGIFAVADLAYYINDDLKASIGYRHMNDTHMAAAGVEYQLQASIFGGGTSIFAEGRVGDNDYAAAWAGVRLYLGAGQKSLIRRHREDDPAAFDETNRRGEQLCFKCAFD
jgi:hypothetical protein